MINNKKYKIYTIKSNSEIKHKFLLDSIDYYLDIYAFERYSNKKFNNSIKAILFVDECEVDITNNISNLPSNSIYLGNLIDPKTNKKLIDIVDGSVDATISFKTEILEINNTSEYVILIRR